MRWRTLSLAAAMLVLLSAYVHTAQTGLLDSAPVVAWIPVQAPATVTVSQGNFDGDHNAGNLSQYAFDFIVGPSEFVVTAARAGVVLWTVRNSSAHCNNSKCWTEANYVLVANADGQTADLYVHLKLNSVLVAPGQPVAAGQPLATADSTGYSTGTHLHFQIEQIPSQNQIKAKVAGWWWTQSLPVSFANPEALRVRPDGVPKTRDVIPLGKGPPTPTPTFTPLAAPSNPGGNVNGSQPTGCTSATLTLMSACVFVVYVSRRKRRHEGAGAQRPTSASRAAQAESTRRAWPPHLRL